MDLSEHDERLWALKRKRAESGLVSYMRGRVTSGETTLLRTSGSGTAPFVHDFVAFTKAGVLADGVQQFLRLEVQRGSQL